LDTNIVTIDDCKRELRITLAAYELEPHYEKAYREAQPEIQVQGFRKGKVPLNIIKKRFGKSIENEAVETIATEVFKEAVKDLDVKPIGQPALKDIQRESDGSLGLTIGYEVLPEFELQEYRNLEIEKLIYPVVEQDIENEIERLTLERSELLDAEQVEDEMFFVSARLNPLDAATGMPLIGAKAEEIRVFLRNEPAGSELKTLLLNTKVGDTFRYALPSLEEGQPAQMTIASVQEIKRVVPGEFTNEFVEVITNGHLSTTEEFRADLEKNIVRARENAIKDAMSNQVVDKILATHSFEIPQSLVQSVISSMLQQEMERMPDKKLPKNFDIRRYVASATPVALNTAKWMIIRERIVEQENITITDEDINAHVVELITEMGMPTENLEYLRSAIAGDETVQNRLMHEKVIKMILDYSVITERDVEFFQAEADADADADADAKAAAKALAE
jgi:trigger factor